MSTRKLFILGSCLLTDLIDHHIDIFDKYFARENIQTTPHRYLPTKISLLNEVPGAIAARLHDEMHSRVYIDLTRADRKLYHKIIKPLRLVDLLKQVTVGDILLMDFHGDMYPTFDNGLEKFEIGPDWSGVKMKYPSWLRHTIDSYPTYQADMISKEQNNIRIRDMKTITTMLSRAFGSNIINIGSVYTNKQYIKELNTVSETLALSDYNFSIPFIKMTAAGNEDHINFAYFERLYDSHDAAHRRFFPDWTLIIPDKSMCFSDPYHKWGQHPCHLHPLSMNQFRKPLEDALIKLCNPNSSSIII